MIDVIENKDFFASEASALKGLAGQPNWLAQLRDQAMHRFKALGWPTTRNEAWRFNNLRPISRTQFTTAPFVSGDTAKTCALEQEGPLLIFTNGKFRPELSRLASESGLIVLPFSQALRGPESTLLEKHLAKHASFEQDAATALNTALWKDALLIKVAAGVQLQHPLEIIHYFEDQGGSFATMPRHLIVAEPGSMLSVVETYVGRAPDCLTNTVTELAVEADAELHHYFREFSAESAWHIHTLAASLSDRSKIQCHCLLNGGAMVRNNMRITFNGCDGEAIIGGLTVAHGNQLHDHNIIMDHVKGHNVSKQFFKGILDERARGVFTSRVIVHKDAQKTDSHQSNRNLLLSDSARVDTQPQLEIYADDVKCAHGATTGQLDEEAMFYMKARGLAPDQARVLLLYAFAHETIDRMPLTSLRNTATAFLLERFAAAGVLGEQA